MTAIRIRNPNATTTIDILRHGKTQADDILRGRIDVPLSDSGYQQMQSRVAPYVQPAAPWQQVITSPLQRCQRFAEHIVEQHQTTMTIDQGFLEMDYGDWDGRRFEDLRAENPVLFTQVWREPHNYSPPNGETFQDFSARITRAWDSLIEQFSGQHVLLICHGGVIRALLGMIMQTPLSSLSRIEVPFACFSRIQVHHKAGEAHWPQLVFHNSPYPSESH